MSHNDVSTERIFIPRLGRGIHCCMLLTAYVFLLAGCSAKWVMEAQPPEARLQWPPAPLKAKAEYVMSISGFKETGVSIRNVIFGKREDKIIQPVAVTAGRDGRIAIADTGCRCVHLYFPSEERYVKIFTDEMASPVGLAFDDELKLYVSDSAAAKIWVFDSGGGYLFALAGALGERLERPTGLAFNAEKRSLYVVDTLSHKIYVADKGGNILSSLGQRGTEVGQFNFPTHIFLSPSGPLYVTDAMNFRVQVFDASGRFLTSFGRHGDRPGDFSMPKGIAVDRDGVIYIVDGLFDNVQLFDERGAFLLTLGSRGNAAGQFWLPSGISIDTRDKLYVCDTFNRRVQVFQLMMNYSGAPAANGDRNAGRQDAR